MKLVHPDAPKNVVDVDDERVELFNKSGWMPLAGEPVDDEDDDNPAGNAALPVWVGYARSRGVTDEELHGKSRDDIRDLFPN